MNGLSDRAKQLIPKARIVSFEGWNEIPPEIVTRFQAADDNKYYLTDADLSAIAAAVGTTDSAISAVGLSADSVVRTLREEAASIVDEARAVVLITFPDILKPGGGLYPPMRAEACWRDFWQFLRCITYGIASGQHHYTSTLGLEAMEQLYDELKVPLSAMVTGLIGVKRASLKRFPVESYPALSPYFDHLIARLSTFIPPEQESMEPTTAQAEV
ncbi:MAG: phycobilisome protein [Cyanobacteria bacterium P01_C01_bin.121]